MSFVSTSRAYEGPDRRLGAVLGLGIEAGFSSTQGKEGLPGSGKLEDDRIAGRTPKPNRAHGLPSTNPPNSTEAAGETCYLSLL
jgi:hypothetical protein